MKLVLFIIKSSWQKLAFGALVSGIAGLCFAYGVKLLTTLIGAEENSQQVFLEMLLMVVLSTGLSIWSGYYLTKLLEYRISELQVDLSRKVLRADFEIIEKYSHRIIPVLHYDVSNIGSFAKTLPNTFVALFKMLAIGGYMFMLSWKLTLSITAVFAVVFLFTASFFPWLQRLQKTIQKHRNDVYWHLYGIVEGIKELTLSSVHQKSYVERTVKPSSESHAKNITTTNTLDILITKSAEFFVLVGIGVIILAMKFSGTFESGLFLDFLTLVLFVLPSLVILTAFGRSVKKVEASLEQVYSLGLEFDDYETSIEHKKLGYTQHSEEPLISLKGVEYQYQNESSYSYKAGPFDLDIFENEVLFINGGNGSGKTTLAKLLTGLYRPQTGSISYQGQEITAENLFNFRDHFSAVFADSHVFQDLNYLSSTINKEEVERYAHQLGIDQKIEVDDLMISNVELSFGQRGRLNLLRVLLEDQPIYLFDEWASNQDPYFRSKFYNEILPGLKAKGKTVIVISHDDQFYHLADRIVTLSGGKIAD